MAERKRRKRNANGQGGVYQRTDGRWEAKIFVDAPDGRRKRISVYGDTQQETLNELTRILDQAARNPCCDNDNGGRRVHDLLA